MSDTTDPKAAAAGGKGRAKGAGKGARAAGAAKGARAGKAGAGKAGAARKTAAAPKVAPTPITGPVEGGTLKTKELLTRVAARSGAATPAARLVMNAVLTELAESLARGESFVLPPLGKGKVRPKKEGAKGEGIMLKLRKPKPKKEGETPLAPAEE